MGSFHVKRGGAQRSHNVSPEIADGLQAGGTMSCWNCGKDVETVCSPRTGITYCPQCGATVRGAIEMAKRVERGTSVVILPDRGDPHLSTSLFTSVCAKCPP